MSANVCGDFTRSDPQERLESGHQCFPAVEAKIVRQMETLAKYISIIGIFMRRI